MPVTTLEGRVTATLSPKLTALTPIAALGGASLPWAPNALPRRPVADFMSTPALPMEAECGSGVAWLGGRVIIRRPSKKAGADFKVISRSAGTSVPSSVRGVPKLCPRMTRIPCTSLPCSRAVMIVCRRACGRHLLDAERRAVPRPTRATANALRNAVIIHKEPLRALARQHTRWDEHQRRRA
jgi:hypothetical protein